SAEGQESKRVCGPNVGNGCSAAGMGTGTSEEIEEERRLLYVAMTRAKEHLRLGVPQRFYVHGQAAQGDRHVYASRTRFIPEALFGFFDSSVWPHATAENDGTAPAASEPKPAIDIAAQMRALWQ